MNGLFRLLQAGRLKHWGYLGLIKPHSLLSQLCQVFSSVPVKGANKRMHVFILFVLCFVNINWSVLAHVCTHDIVI